MLARHTVRTGSRACSTLELASGTVGAGPDSCCTSRAADGIRLSLRCHGGRVREKRGVAACRAGFALKGPRFRPLVRTVIGFHLQARERLGTAPFVCHVAGRRLQLPLGVVTVKQTVNRLVVFPRAGRACVCAAAARAATAACCTTAGAA